MMSETTNLETRLTEFETYLKGLDRSPHSIRAYLSDLRLFAEWFKIHTGENFAITNVLDDDIKGWRDEAEKKQKASTVNRKLAALSTFFAWAVEKKVAINDPTRNIHGLGQQELAPKSLSELAVNKIIRKARLSGNLRDHALLQFLAATGLRASEAAAVICGDLQIGERSGWVTVRSGKGRRQRRVPIHARAREALQSFLESEGRKDLSGYADEPLFKTRYGETMTHYAIWYTVKKYATQAGVENVSPHSFRHTVATRLVRNPQVDIVTAATFLGHSRLDTTARYSRPSDEDLEHAAEEIS
jgi:integrase/recombinase XerC